MRQRRFYFRCLALLAISSAACGNEETSLGSHESALSSAAPAQTADTADTQELDRLHPEIRRQLAAFQGAVVHAVGGAGQPLFVTGQLGRIAMGADGAVSESRLQPALESLAPIFGLNPSELKYVATARDSLGYRHARFAQRKNGLPVVGGELLVHVRNDGTVYAVNGTVRGADELPANPQVSTHDAQRTVETEGSSQALRAEGQPRLVYLLTSEEDLVLAWEVDARGGKPSEPVHDLVYVDALKGQIAARHPLVHSALTRIVYDSGNRSILPGTMRRSEWDPPTPDAVVNTQYDLLGSTYACFQSLFGRDSFDSRDASLVSSVHYGSRVANAAWTGSQMFFGDGDGARYGNFATSMDVTAHEMTHAVTQYSAGLVYSGESGGMNESMSDVFGNVCEAFRAGRIDGNTWLVGEDVTTPGIPGDAIRYMNNPSQDGYSIDHYDDFRPGTDVHFSSGIGNLAFYLTSQGGRHPRSRTSITVPALGIDRAQQIWYRALTVYMTSGSNFRSARLATAQAAADLYGKGASDAVHSAWAAVGVGVLNQQQGIKGWSGPDFWWKNQLLRRQGYTLDTLRSYDIGGSQIRFDAFWSRSNVEQIGIHEWAPDAFWSKYVELNGMGYKLTTVEAYDIGGYTTRFDAFFSPSSTPQIGIHGWAPDHFWNKYVEMSRRGYGVSALRSYQIASGVTRYDAFWTPSASGQYGISGWERDHFWNQHLLMQKAGHRLVAMDSHDVGGGKIFYDAFWDVGGGSQPAIFGWAPDHFWNEWQSKSSAGYRLGAVEAIPVGGGNFLYDAVFNP